MDLELWQILVLAIVQGVAEFLPISSSGHLVIVANLLSPGASAAEFDIAELNIVLHAGTLASILVFYWQRIWRLLGEDRRVLPVLVVGTLPAVVIGLVIKTQFESILSSVQLTGAMLCITGVVLWLTTYVPEKEAPEKEAPEKEGDYTQLGFGRAFLLGLSQAVAIIPGISRSGMTISAGIGLGLSRQSAATFSFLLAIPAIGGATVLELKDVLQGTPMTLPAMHLLIGAVVAFAVGLVSLRFLVSLLERGRLHYFAFWCIPVGLAVLAWKSFG